MEPLAPEIDELGFLFYLQKGKEKLSYGEVLTLWQHDSAFRAWFIALLGDIPFEAFRWEVPVLTKATGEQQFAFAVLDSPELVREANPSAFVSMFSQTEPVVAFANLGNTATLIAPCPMSPADDYGHLAAFVRNAPEAQQHALWALVGKAVQAQLSATPLWLSTAGAGVPWLHVRIDKRPKYYRYLPYTKRY